MLLVMPALVTCAFFVLTRALLILEGSSHLKIHKTLWFAGPRICPQLGRVRGQPVDPIAQVTDEFLEYTKARGNDLSTPRPPRFPGLKPGDRWCLCVSR